MMKNNICISILLILMVLAGISCKKDQASEKNPVIEKPLILFSPNVSYGTMTDQEGNLYKTIKIGTQTWMAENLRTKNYNDGTPINSYIQSIAKCYSYAGKSDSIFIYTYGLLYNWYAVNTGKLAPEGWHVPSYAEWATMITFLGGESVAGDKLKETGTTHWKNPDNSSVIATNESGFTALPAGGDFDDNNDFADLSLGSHWWTVTEINTNEAYSLNMAYYASWALLVNDVKYCSYSIRCVKD